MYLDNILIIGKTSEDHLENVARVLDQLQEAGLKLKLCKCNFFTETGSEYLGHTISDQGISPDARKVEAIKNFPTPIDPKVIKVIFGPCFLL